MRQEGFRSKNAYQECRCNQQSAHCKTHQGIGLLLFLLGHFGRLLLRSCAYGDRRRREGDVSFLGYGHAADNLILEINIDITVLVLAKELGEVYQVGGIKL